MIPFGSAGDGVPRQVGWVALPAVNGSSLLNLVRRLRAIDAELLGSVSVQGDIYSANWDGDVPADVPASGATSGYYIDSSLGSAQFTGDLHTAGTIYADNVVIDAELLVLPTKADTGDPSSGGSVPEGALYVNLQDNALRLFADGSWRSVLTW